ncbi:MAG: DUF2075 domain-containing protein [Armatimonadetes bacterium]|nr:DUF2075 domain-containing protein [Armatimonadota bacterium]
MTDPLPRALPRAYYESSFATFRDISSESILGRITANSDFAVLQSQRDAWLTEIEVLRPVLERLTGTIFMEFNIPRMGRRVDVVLISGAVIFVIEFKVGAKDICRGDLDQVWDYALDLKNFHKGSHSARIIPILVATEVETSSPFVLSPHDDEVHVPISCSDAGLRALIDLGLKVSDHAPIDAERWYAASYHPTPTIIEAAQTLYAQHSVDSISRHDAGAKNLHVTTHRIKEIVDTAQRDRRKIVCFVTGVPGAGKTLVGLNVATQRRDSSLESHAVYLSGNVPLVAVLREALTRDEVARRRSQNEKVRKGEVAESVKAFIQNVHHFRDECLRDKDPPLDHIVIFDEAQRAWNLEQTAKFMRNRKKQAGFVQSEPEFLISCLDRHTDWAVIVCLVGGGQEINTGEAGIGAWLDAMDGPFKSWDVYISPELNDSEYAAGHAIERIRSRSRVFFDSDLHLSVSMRSFRSDKVSQFVKAVLDCDSALARSSFADLASRFPLAVTRDLSHAKGWILEHARGSERYGLVASSQAQRLKPHAIDVRVKVDPVHWFLNGPHDTRSSFYLEDAATEFQVQGLELDWVCVTWDGDFRFNDSNWNYYSFRGDAWCSIRKSERQTYLRNAYRVLLTRARQGMVIFVPDGVPDDPTRSPAFYDSTFDYLAGLGIPVLGD